MKNMMVKLSKIGLLFYTILLSYWMILGFGRRHTYSEYMYNLIPFKTINQFLQIDKFNTDVWVINIFGNIGVFLPFGILLPVIFGEKMMKSFTIFIVGLFILESLQLVTKRGSFDIDDFILNSLGFLIGYGLYKAFIVLVKAKKQ